MSKCARCSIRTLSNFHHGREAAIPPQILATLTNRYVRGRSYQTGRGLGLAIIKAIITDCGSQFGLVSPAKGRKTGLDAMVNFANETNAV
ncbi:MAG: nitrogen fixation/metabolism regulation signal transduction histidine kinase [Paracoccaceae bacterium]|jgi:nitrogen fixation/metabolism regulation signal transduction histidine kinase